MYSEGRGKTAPPNTGQQGQSVFSDVIPRAGAHAINGGNLEYLERCQVHPLELSKGPQSSEDHLSESHDEVREFRVPDFVRV